MAISWELRRLISVVFSNFAFVAASALHSWNTLEPLRVLHNQLTSSQLPRHFCRFLSQIRQTFRHFLLGSVQRPLASAPLPAWIRKKSTEFLWCSGYHVCFTRTRSPVRSRAETLFIQVFCCVYALCIYLIQKFIHTLLKVSIMKLVMLTIAISSSFRISSLFTPRAYCTRNISRLRFT